MLVNPLPSPSNILPLRATILLPVTNIPPVTKSEPVTVVFTFISKPLCSEIIAIAEPEFILLNCKFSKAAAGILNNPLPSP